jgi:tRNA(adenine34) deaminase
MADWPDKPQHLLDEQYMRLALDEALAAADEDEVPIGAVIVRGGAVIGRGHNQRERLADPTAHAEMIAITAAAESLRDWRLIDCTMYVTLEPCLMCAGAILQARLPRLVYGVEDPKAGACGTLYNVIDDERLNHRVECAAGVLAADCRDLLQHFFEKKRRMGKK